MYSALLVEAIFDDLFCKPGFVLHNSFYYYSIFFFGGIYLILMEFFFVAYNFSKFKFIVVILIFIILWHGFSYFFLIFHN